MSEARLQAAAAALRAAWEGVLRAEVAVLVEAGWTQRSEQMWSWRQDATTTSLLPQDQAVAEVLGALGAP